jgi:transcriptional regulator with XRE-family HTH domain
MSLSAETFNSRFKLAYEKSQASSLRSLAKMSGNSPAMMNKIANGDYSQNNGPGLFAIHRLADAMGVTLDDLVPLYQRPTIQEFIDCHPGIDTPNVSIDAFSRLLPHCDVYHRPENGITSIKRTGPESLVRRKTGLSDPALIQSEYLSWSAARRKRIFERQERAWEQAVLAELDFFNEMSSVLNKQYRIPFWLGICRAVDVDGEEVLIIFCEAILK